jgi:hypothetical protein
MAAYTPRDPHDPEYNVDLEIESECAALQREATLAISHLLTFVVGLIIGVGVL